MGNGIFKAGANQIQRFVNFSNQWKMIYYFQSCRVTAQIHAQSTTCSSTGISRPIVWLWFYRSNDQTPGIFIREWIECQDTGLEVKERGPGKDVYIFNHGKLIRYQLYRSKTETPVDFFSPGLSSRRNGWAWSLQTYSKQPSNVWNPIASFSQYSHFCFSAMILCSQSVY